MSVLDPTTIATTIITTTHVIITGARVISTLKLTTDIMATVIIIREGDAAGKNNFPWRTLLHHRRMGETDDIPAIGGPRSASGFFYSRQ